MTEKIDLSVRQHVSRQQSIPNFSNRQYVTGKTSGTSAAIFRPNAAVTVQWVYAQLSSACVVQLLFDGQPISAPYNVPASSIVRFPGFMLPNNSVLTLAVSAGTAQFEVAFVKDFRPELIVQEPALYLGSSGGSGGTVTANQGTALAGSKWSVQIDGPNPLPVSEATLDGCIAASKVAVTVNPNPLPVSEATLDGCIAASKVAVTVNPNPLPVTAAQGAALAAAKWSVQIDAVAAALADANPLPVKLEPATKATYRMCIAGGAAITTANSIDIIFIGSATKVVRIQRIFLTANIGTAALCQATISRYSTAPTAGTVGVTAAPIPVDPADAASSAVMKSYTAAPTAGTLIGTFAVLSGLVPSATVAGNFIFDLRSGDVPGSKQLTLPAGAAHCFGFNFNAAIFPQVIVEYTEE